MQIKEVKPINFLYFRTKTKVGDLGRYVGIIARSLYRDAALNDIEVTGPVYWNYFGFQGDSAQEFTLEIALPVAEIPVAYAGKFRFRRADNFHCVSFIHMGSWYDMPRSYARLLEYMGERHIHPGIETRELYLNIDFTNPEANITEIQISIPKESFVHSQTKSKGVVTELSEIFPFH